MFKIAVILLGLAVGAFAQTGVDGEYAPVAGLEYDSVKDGHHEQEVHHENTVHHEAPKVVHHETAVHHEAKPASHHTIGHEAKRVNYINGRRQHYVNVKAVHHGASAGTAPEYGVPGTRVGEHRRYGGDYYDNDRYYDNDGYYDDDHYDGGYYGRDHDGYGDGYRRGYSGGYRGHGRW